MPVYVPRMNSYQVNPNLYLVVNEVSKAPATKIVDVPVDHILVYDCSGSMSYDLPKIREQVKKKLPKMLGPNDRLSIVWFSGRVEHGILLEAEPVATLSDLKTIEQTIDRWLRPVGMTGFKGPLEDVVALAQRLEKTGGNRARSMMFFTDGCDNQSSQNEVLKAVENAGMHVQSATFVEYGYYANRPLLAQMAEKSGGSLIFAETFDKYEPQFEASIKRKSTNAKRIEVTLKGDPVGGFAYALQGGDLVTFGVEGGKISVPEDLGQFYYLSPSCVGTLASGTSMKGLDATLSAVYAAISLFSVRMKPDVVLPLLKVTGDARFIKDFSTCFGKQKYSAFMDATKAAAFDRDLRLKDGYNPNLVPPDDAVTVLDVLETLYEDESARILLNDMTYTSIGRGRLDATDQLTAEEQTQVDTLTEEMGKTKDAKKIRLLAQQIADITDKPEALKFKREVPSSGLPIKNLTFNEDRPNVSFLVQIPGTIDLSSRIDKATIDLTGVPTIFKCFQFRNYAVIKDGLVNIEKLPVIVSQKTFDKFLAEGVVTKEDVLRLETDGHSVGLCINLKSLPVINRKMVKELSAKTFFETAYEVTKAKAAQKVLKDYAKSLLPEKQSVGYADKYGQEIAVWLKEQGITDYNGFQPPHTTSAPTTDVYTGKELKVSLKGLSSLPKVAEVKAKIQKVGSKLNAPSALMAETIKEVEAFLSSAVYLKAADQPGVLQAWLDGQTKASIRKTRALMLDMAKFTFTTVVGQTWFKEFSSVDQTDMTITVDGNDIPCKVEMKEIEIRV
jgi:hypothetical protein